MGTDGEPLTALTWACSPPVRLADVWIQLERAINRDFRKATLMSWRFQVTRTLMMTTEVQFC
jgi:hypothetical protein